MNLIKTFLLNRKYIDWKILSFPQQFIINYFLKNIVKSKIVLLSDIYKYENNIVEKIFDQSIVNVFLQQVLSIQQEFVELNLPPLYSYKFNNALININSSCILYNDRLIRETYFEDERYNEGFIEVHGRKYAALRMFDEIIIDDNAFFLGGNGSWNWYHFLIEIAPKMLFLDRIGVKTILINQEAYKYESVKSIINLFIDNTYTIIQLDPKFNYKVKHLTHITSVSNVKFNSLSSNKFSIFDCFHRNDLIKKFSEYILDKLKISSSANKKNIFIVRSSHRLPRNHDDLIENMQKNSFLCIKFENLTFHQQLEYILNANIIVGITGAFFSNIIFGKPNLKGICIMPDNFKEFSCFSNLAKIFNINLYHFYYQNKENSQHSNSYEVNINELNKLIKEIN